MSTKTAEERADEIAQSRYSDRSAGYHALLQTITAAIREAEEAMHGQCMKGIAAMERQRDEETARAERAEALSDDLRQQVQALTEMRDEAIAEMNKVGQRAEKAEAKMKETAKDFETAFRVVRRDNDLLLAALEVQAKINVNDYVCASVSVAPIATERQPK